MAMKDLKSVLEPKEEETESPEMEESEDSGSDVYVDELVDILGIDASKAARLKEAICGMMEEKGMMGDSYEEPKKPMGGPGKKKGLAIVLGS